MFVSDYLLGFALLQDLCTLLNDSYWAGILCANLSALVEAESNCSFRGGFKFGRYHTSEFQKRFE